MLPHATMHVGQHLGVFMNISYHKTPLNIKITKKLKQHLKNEDELKKKVPTNENNKNEGEKRNENFPNNEDNPKNESDLKKEDAPKN